MPVAVGGVVLALACTLPLFRQTRIPSWQTIWAEDGSVYFGEAHRDGPIAVLLRPYNGYLQLPPRLLGALSTLAPISALPLWLAVSGTIVTACLAWFVYWASAEWIGSRLVRGALASLVVLMPSAGFENTACITNVIWAFAAVAPWALLAVPHRRSEIAACAAVAFLAATSTPLCVIFLPLAIGMALLRWNRAALVVVGAFCIGLVTQGAVMAAGTQSLGLGSDASLSLIAELLSVRLFAIFLIGEKGAAACLQQGWFLLLLACPFVTAALFACLFPAAGRRSQVLASLFIILAIVGFIAPSWTRGINPFVGEKDIFHMRPRFSVMPVLMLASAVAVLIAPIGHPRERLVARIGRVVFVAHVAVLTAWGFSQSNMRSMGPPWPVALRWAFYRDCARTASEEPVGVLESNMFGWKVPLSCREVASAVAP